MDPGGNEVNQAQSTDKRGILGAIRDFFSSLGRSGGLSDLRYTSGDGGGGDQVGPFGGIEGVRYINTTRYGWIDMGHFGQAAAVARDKVSKKFGLFSNLNFPTAYGWPKGKLWEETVANEESQGPNSKWSFEDGPSNLAGFDFYWDYYNGDKTLMADLETFFDDAGATQPTQSAIWDRIPIGPQEDRVFQDNRSFSPMHNPDSYSGQSNLSLAPELTLRPKARPFP